jgi:hypothetical protein
MFHENTWKPPAEVEKPAEETAAPEVEPVKEEEVEPSPEQIAEAEKIETEENKQADESSLGIRIRKFYAEHNPEKLEDPAFIKKCLAKHGTDETQLIELLEAKAKYASTMPMSPTQQAAAATTDADEEEPEKEPEEQPEKPITADCTGFLGVFRSHQKGFKGGNSIAARSVKSTENWRWHYHVLSGLELLYYPSTQKEVLGVGSNAKQDSDGQRRKLQPKGKYIIRDDTSPADSDGNSFCLEVTDNGMSKVLLMVTEHAEDKKLWIENINKAIATRKAEKVASGEDKENTASTVSTSANMRSPLRPSNGTAATREGPSKKMSGPWSVTDSKENSAAGAKPAMDSNKGMSTKERCKAISSNDKPSATPYDVTKGASITGFLNVYRSKWKGWETRFFVLQDKTLWYYPTNEDIMKASEKTSLGDGTFVRLQPEGGLQIPEGCSVIEGDAKYKRKYCIEVVDSLINTVVVLACETHMEKCTWISKLESFFSTDHVCASDDIKNKAGGGLRRSKDQDITKSKKDPVNITWEDKTADNYQMLPTLELND